MFKELPFESLARHKTRTWQKAKSCLFFNCKDAAKHWGGHRKRNTTALVSTPAWEKSSSAEICKSNQWGSAGREDKKHHPKILIRHLSITYIWAVPPCPRRVKIHTDNLSHPLREWRQFLQAHRAELQDQCWPTLPYSSQGGYTPLPITSCTDTSISLITAPGNTGLLQQWHH